MEALILFAALMLIALGLVLTLNRLTVCSPSRAPHHGRLSVHEALPVRRRSSCSASHSRGACRWRSPPPAATCRGRLAAVPRDGDLGRRLRHAVRDGRSPDDDLKIGVRSTAILFGDLDRVFIGGLQLLLLASLVPRRPQRGARGLVLRRPRGRGAVLVYQQLLIRDRDIVSRFRAFLNNAWLGGAVFCGIAARLPRFAPEGAGSRRCAQPPRPSQRAAPAASSAAASAFTVAPVVITSSTIAIRRPATFANDRERVRHACARGRPPPDPSAAACGPRRAIPRCSSRQRERLRRALRAISVAWL